MSIYCTMNIENNLRCPCILIYEANVERFQKRWGTPSPPPSPHLLLSISYGICILAEKQVKEKAETLQMRANERFFTTCAHYKQAFPILKLFTLPPKKVYDKKSYCSAITMVPPRNQISQYTSLKGKLAHNFTGNISLFHRLSSLKHGRVIKKKSLKRKKI